MRDHVVIRQPITRLALGALLLGMVATAAGCNPKGSCESTQKNDPSNQFCLDDQKKSECEAESSLANHVFDAKSCADRGYKKCGKLPMSMKNCPGEDEGKSAVSSSAPKGSEPAAEAAPWASPGGNYTIKFSSKVTEAAEKDPKGFTWTTAKAEVGAYSASYGDFPTAAAASAAVDEYKKTMAGEIKEDKEVSTGDHKGHEFKMIISPTATMWMRMFAIDKRVYKVAAGTKNDEAKAYRFLDSFVVTASASPEAPASGAAVAGPPPGSPPAAPHGAPDPAAPAGPKPPPVKKTDDAF